MMSNLERLVYMANQIARNFEAQGQDHAVAATADHIASFWAPRMKEQIFACLKNEGQSLSDTARVAIEQLRDKGAPGSRSRVTKFNAVDEAGRSDAG